MAFHRHQRHFRGFEAGLVALLRAATGTRWATTVCILLFPFTPALAEVKVAAAPTTVTPAAVKPPAALTTTAPATAKPAATPTTAVSPEAKPVTAPTTAAPSDVKPAVAVVTAAPTTAAPGTILRAVSLHDLGLAKGIDFSNLSGYKELFFPIPHRGFQAATLRLNLRSGAAFEGQRHLEVAGLGAGRT